jgi:hypothetical protein
MLSYTTAVLGLCWIMDKVAASHVTSGIFAQSWSAGKALQSPGAGGTHTQLRHDGGKDR